MAELLLATEHAYSMSLLAPLGLRAVIMARPDITLPSASSASTCEITTAVASLHASVRFGILSCTCSMRHAGVHTPAIA